VHSGDSGAVASGGQTRSSKEIKCQWHQGGSAKLSTEGETRPVAGLGSCARQTRGHWKGAPCRSPSLVPRVGLEIAGPDLISDVVGLMMEVWRIRSIVPDLGLLREQIRKRVKRKARRLEKLDGEGK
jgi:hypothetical protein